MFTTACFKEDFDFAVYELNISTGERKRIASGFSGSRGILFLNEKLYIMQSGKLSVIDISGGVEEDQGVVENLNLTFSGYTFLPQFYYSFGGIATIDLTPVVFCAVIAVTAVMA